MPKKRTFNHGDAAARARRAYERLGTTEPACAVCGETRPTILERHHIAGKDYDPETMILCRNHHGLITDAQKDFPNGGSDLPNYLECIGRMLLNLAELFAILVEKLREYGAYLIELEQKNPDSGAEVS